MKTTLQNRRSERGNALFLILIAVALFAALSYAVTQSGRGGGGNTNRETATINAGLITDFPAAVRTAATRMILTNAATTGTINFIYGATSPAYTAATDAENIVFGPTLGGGVTYVAPPASGIDSTTPVGSNGVGTTGWRFKMYNNTTTAGHYLTGVATGAADAFAFVGVTAATCRAINAGLGLGSTITVEATAFATTAAGGEADPAGTDATRGATGNGTRLGKGLGAGQSFACVANSNDATAAPYIYFHALVEN